MKISFKAVACLSVVATIYLVSILSGREPPDVTAALANVFWFGLKFAAIALALGVGLIVFVKIIAIARWVLRKLPAEIRLWLESADADLKFFFVLSPIFLMLTVFGWWTILHEMKYPVSLAAVLGIWVASFLLAACGGKLKIWQPLPRKMAIAFSVAVTSGYTSMGFFILSMSLLSV